MNTPNSNKYLSSASSGITLSKPTSISIKPKTSKPTYISIKPKTSNPTSISIKPKTSKPNLIPKDNYPNFSKGETLNPASVVISGSLPALNPSVSRRNSSSIISPIIPNNCITSPHLNTSLPTISKNSSTVLTPASPAFCDPLIPPLVNLTQKSVADMDSRYVLARHRDSRIFENVRLFLSFLHDKEDSVCINGKTNTEYIS